MNNLSLTEKKKLLSLAKRLKAASHRRDNYARQANNIVRNSEITISDPTTNASRNVLRRIARLARMMNYTNGHLRNVARKLVANFPALARMHPNNIIRNTSESIRRHEMALRNIHSGRYQTHGRSSRVRSQTPRGV